MGVLLGTTPLTTPQLLLENFAPFPVSSTPPTFLGFTNIAILPQSTHSNPLSKVVKFQPPLTPFYVPFQQNKHSTIEIILLLFYYGASPKIESPITRAFLRYAPWTVPTDCRTIGHLKIRSRPGLMSRERIHNCTDRATIGTVQGAYRKYARVIGDFIQDWRHSRIIVE